MRLGGAVGAGGGADSSILAAFFGFLIFSSLTPSSFTLASLTLASLTLASLTLGSLTLGSLTFASLTFASLTFASLTLDKEDASMGFTTFGAFAVWATSILGTIDTPGNR